MGFRKPNAERVNLKDYEGDIVALKAVRWERGVRVNLPGEGMTTRDALLAKIAVVTSDGPMQVGETLVFYKVVADAVERAAPDWTLGVLSRTEGESYEYFVLEDLPEDLWDRTVSAFTAAGIS